MKLIVALGNPGPEYAKTRHNTGFMVAGYYQDKHHLADFSSKKKFHAEICEFSKNNQKIIIAKPTTFYNLTGNAVRSLVDFYNISPENVLVIHDELMLDFGTIRVRDTGSDAGNNGLKSIISAIGQDFWRIRIGIKNSISDQLDSADFVTKPFSANEQLAMNSTILESASQLIDHFIDGTLSKQTEKNLSL